MMKIDDDIIEKKENGQELTQKEIAVIINKYHSQSLDENLMKRFLRAIKKKGMTVDETVFLTQAIVATSVKINWNRTKIKSSIKIDQPSTGGIGNKSPLIVPPIVASAGVVIPKMSTRGSVAGTIDILESIGYVADIPTDEFIKNVEEFGFSNICQTDSLAPVDEKMMRLRRETETMKQDSLVVSSILSKKMAIGCDRLLVDIKAGPDSKFGDYSNTFKAAQMFVEVGDKLGIKVVSVVTNNYQPQGIYIGNSLSLIETFEILNGNGPIDQREICIYLASWMFFLAERVCNIEEGKKLTIENIESGKALAKFRQQLKIHKADLKKIDNLALLQDAEYKTPIIAECEGFVAKIDVNKVDICAKMVICKEKKIAHYNTGIVLKKKVGDYTVRGDVLAVIHSNDHSILNKAENILHSAYILSPNAIPKIPYILGYVDANGTHTFWEEK